jgi:putative MATE family efflux protein
MLLDLRMDKELREVLTTSLPLVFVELVASLYSITDTYFVSGLGTEALAALGIALYVFTLLQAFLVLILTPLLIMVSQGIGAHKLDLARSIITELIIVGGIYASILEFIFYLLSEPLVIVISNPKGITLSYTVEYLKVRCLGLLVLYITMAFDMVIISTGKTIYTLIANGSGLVFNAVLDPLLIYGYFGLPRLRILGAAIATVVSNAMSIPLQLILLRRLNLTPSRRILFTTWKKALKLGVPALVERLVFSVGNIIYAGIIARLGESVMAAHNVGLRVESLIYMPGFAFTQTASTLIGRRIGHGDIEDAKNTGWRVIKLGSIIMGLLSIFIGTTGYYLAAPFSPSEVVRRLASLYLMLAGFSEFGLGLAMVTSGAIRGAGNTKIPFYINALSLILVRVTLSLILANNLGPIGPWFAMFLDVYVRGIILSIIYKKYFHKLVHIVIS